MSTPEPLHPSYLALDRASLAAGTAEVQAHLAQCSECSAYVASIQGPASAAGLATVRRRIAGERKLSWLRWAAAPLAVAAAFALWFGVRPQPALPEQPVYIGEKGFQSVWIYVRHGAVTALWDGKRPVFTGDRLRMKVDPGRFKRVAVYSVKDPSAPELLYVGGVVPGQSTALPDAWEVDAEPGDERLMVVLSNEPVSPDWTDWLRGKAQPGIALLPFVLPKSSMAGPTPGSTGQ